MNPWLAVGTLAGGLMLPTATVLEAFVNIGTDVSFEFHASG